MANEYGHLQWTLDTAGSQTTERVRIRSMWWTPSAAADDLSIVDKNGEIIWKTIAGDGTNPDPQFIDFGDKGMNFNGFNLSVLDGGTLNVYFA